VSRHPPRRGHLASRRFGERGALSPRIDALFEGLDRPGHPGGMVAVLRGDRVIHRAAYGVASVEHDLPFSDRTVLRWGSTTKHVAATALLLLEDRGLLSLDDDVRRFVPELPPRPDGDVLRLRHLLTMTSGIPDGLSRLLFAGHSARHPILQSALVELARRGAEPMFRPGEQCSYSNTNYSLVALTLERVTGTSLRAFLRQEIFAPLGMTRTDLVPDAREIVRDAAVGYEPADPSAPLAAVTPGAAMRSFFPVELAADGGIDSTLDDLVRWLRCYRAGGRSGDGAPLVARWRQRLEAEGVLANGERTGYALGLVVDRYRGLRKVGHSGGMPGYLCDLALYEDPQGRIEDIGFVGLWNWLDPLLLESAARVADLVLESEGIVEPATSPAPATAAAPDGLYACDETGELLHVLEQEGRLACFYLGESTPLQAETGGWLVAAKRGLGFALRPIAGAPDAAVDALEARFGASPTRIFRAVRAAESAGVAGAPFPALAGYVGRYRSDELGEEMVVTVAPDAGALSVELASPLRALLWRELRRLSGDLFHAVIAGCPTVTNVPALFRRDARGDVVELQHQTSRAGVVRFARVPSAPAASAPAAAVPPSS
jgi:CubicO group peptidase (beta-lactamase class C family)